MADTIRYLPRAVINIESWDRCISHAPNGLIYAYSFYLDNMARHWDALVWGDYECVMPITWNKKLGISYLYQPPFTASLGIFGNKITDSLIMEFICSIPSRYKLVEIDMNFGNKLSFPYQNILLRENYILDLNNPYEKIYAGYRDNIKRNCKKAQQLNCRYSDNVEVAEVIRLSQLQMRKLSGASPEDFRRFKNLFHFLQARGEATACGVYMDSGELMASCVFFFSHNRAYYILVGNHPNGKTIGASHFLIDRFISEHAGKNLLLDFEGSDIRNLAFFYSSFGAVVETYPALHIDRLPWWLRLIKNVK